MATSSPQNSANFSSYTRRQFIKRTTLGAGALGLGLAAARAGVAQSGAKQPNLFFIFSDQQSWDMMGCYGNEQIQTPHMDRFAGEGIRFNHCVSNSPVCTAYRGLLLTGQNPLRNGCVRNGYRLLVEPGARFGEVLRDNGYRTAYVGKWHLYGAEQPVPPVPAGPDRHGFDELFLTNNCHADFRPGQAYWFDQHTGEKHIFDVWEQHGQTNQCLDYLNTCSPNDEKPFALFLSWHPPHNHVGMAYPAPAEFEALYPMDKIRVRPDAVKQDNPVLRGQYQGHMALCSSIDHHFGQLMAKLKERGLDENTIVVYTSDHGDMMRYMDGHRPQDGPKFRYMKSQPQTTSCRVPLLMRHPGKLKPRVSDLLVGGMDLMPTLLSMMNLPVPKVVDGRDLSGFIAKGDDSAVQSLPLMLSAGRGWRGIYTREHIYSFEILNGDWRQEPRYQILIDHLNDPYALNNMFGNANHAGLQDELHKQAMEWCERFGDEGWTPFQIDEFCRASFAQNPRLLGDPGILLGPPAEVLKAAGVRGKFTTPNWVDAKPS